MVENNTASVPQSFSMNGGNGTYSYSQNSSYQREALVITKAMIDEAIAEKLDIEKFSSSSKTFRIADLGCSVGPNTYISMQNVLEAVEKKYKSKFLAPFEQQEGEMKTERKNRQTNLKGLDFQLPEFQVFFNDHSTNDFNTLFASFPPEKRYFAAGVPGSFYGRLFPENSIHIVHASYALHWLSKVPEEVQDRKSPAWNKGRIFYSSANDDVADSYAAQFAMDMDNFLNLRAKEIVVGGMMILVMTTIQDEFHRSQMASGWLFDMLGLSLMDMAHEGLISESRVDAFNLPLYTTTPKEMAGLVERNGFFSIERMKLTDPLLNIDEKNVDIQVCTMHIRAAVEGVLIKHFGSEIIDELFDRFHHKAAWYNLMDSHCKKGNLMFLVVKRK